jgi:hypothetical protein
MMDKILKSVSQINSSEIKDVKGSGVKLKAKG